jgi:hypothetical protein
LPPDVFVEIDAKLDELSFETRQSFKYEFVRRGMSVPISVAQIMDDAALMFLFYSAEALLLE